MIERLQNQVDEIELWDVELEDMPNLEASDIPGVYFNEFREYVDEEGNILSPSEVDRLRYKGDYEDVKRTTEQALILCGKTGIFVITCFVQ